MRRQHPGFALFEVLEQRMVLSGTSGAFLPYSLLNIHGSYLAGATTTVTFTSGSESIAVPPSEVTPTLVTVAIPGFFNAKTGASIAAKVDVFVAQTLLGGQASSVRAFHNFSVAALPTTGLPAGTLVEALAEGEQSLLADATAGFSASRGSSGFDAFAVTKSLQALDTALTSLVAEIEPVAQGTAKSVALGTYQGQPVFINAATLALGDRVIATVTDDPTGYTPHAKPLQGSSLTSELEGLVQGAVSQGSRILVQESNRFLDVLSTIPGTKVLAAGAPLAGLTIGDAVALTAVAEAKAGTASAIPPDPTQVDQFLASPAILPGYELILDGFVPDAPAGQPVVDAARANQALADELPFSLAIPA